MIKKIARYTTRRIAWSVYNNFAKYLPVSYSPLGLGLTKPFRGMLCRFIFKKCGRNINVERGASIGANIEIGDNSGIGINAILNTSGGIVIGKDVMIGQDVVILTRNHEFNDLTKPMRLQGYTTALPVVIEDDVWIGTRVIILPGVTIGKSSIVGAGAVVTKNIPPFSIAVGNPARVIKHRTDNAPLSVSI